MEDRTGPCASWAAGDALMKAYHDHRWCVPVHDDRELFAMLVLEGMQAGLSWRTVIHREEALRRAFDYFDIAAVAACDDAAAEALMTAPGVIHNRGKIRSAISNARAVQTLCAQGEFASFNDYIWHFTDGRRIVHHPQRLEEVPAQNELSRAVSRDMKRRGFSFVGPVIIYSYLQGVGVIDDHLDGCAFKNLSTES